MTIISEQYQAFIIEPDKEYTFYIYRSMATPHKTIKILGRDLNKTQVLLLYDEWLIKNGFKK